ncbi:hypothetical protein PGB90_002830 [Kerria lacca]
MSFLKIKRKHEEDPKEVFILACKKTKLEDLVDLRSIFELTDSAVEEHNIQNVMKKTIENHQNLKLRKYNLEKIRNKMRINNLEYSYNNKLKTLNCIRKINSFQEEQGISIIDIIDDTEKDENHQQYVYDLYYSKTCVDVNDPNFINNYYIQEVNELCIAEEPDVSDEDEDEDEDDSNDESNWRNDYPDEKDSDSYSNISEDEYLSSKMQKTYLSSKYSLSSDEFDEIIDDSYNTNENHKLNKDFDYYDEVASDTNSNLN